MSGVVGSLLAVVFGIGGGEPFTGWAPGPEFDDGVTRYQWYERGEPTERFIHTTGDGGWAVGLDAPTLLRGG